MWVKVTIVILILPVGEKQIWTQSMADQMLESNEEDSGFWVRVSA